jgi:hypothetical protein
MELWFIEKIEFLKECGSMIKEKVKVMKGIQMVILMKEILSREKPMGKEFIIGQMEKFMTENGERV